VTRASARARFRSRQKSDQLDLVDLIQALPPGGMPHDPNDHGGTPHDSEAEIAAP
jgi:hypothetical protein